MFNKAPLYTTAKTWKQPRCPAVGEWISKLEHPDNEILFSANKLSKYSHIY